MYFSESCQKMSALVSWSWKKAKRLAWWSFNSVFAQNPCWLQSWLQTFTHLQMNRWDWLLPFSPVIFVWAHAHRIFSRSANYKKFCKDSNRETNGQNWKRVVEWQSYRYRWDTRIWFVFILQDRRCIKTAFKELFSRDRWERKSC